MKKKNIVYLIIILLIISLAGYGIINWATSPGKYDDFANCLTGKGIIMYGTEWCHFCKQQKSLFGKSFKKVDYVNCDFNKQECEDADVEGYPTWVINDENYPGVQSLEYLSALSECDIEV